MKGNIRSGLKYITPSTRMVGVDVQLHALLTSALDGDRESASLCRLNSPGKDIIVTTIILVCYAIWA
jgi:hypothetical protein